MSSPRESLKSPPGIQDQARRRAKLTHLESDLAYFQARLELIGNPETSNQNAQRKAFKLLYRAVGQQIVVAKERMVAGK